MNLAFNSNMSSMSTKTKRSKFGFGGLVFLLLVGLAFVGGGIIMHKANQIYPSWVKIDGKVVSFSERAGDENMMYRPVVEYIVSNKEYKISSSVSSSSKPTIGSVKEVAYNPAEPSDSKVIEGSAKLIATVLIVLGTLTVIIGVVSFIKSRKRTKVINDLTKSGQKVEGVITELQGGNNNSFRVVVTATALDGSVKSYISDSLTGIGGLAMMDFQANPIPVDVYLDSANPDNYYVDVADLPSLNSERIAELVQFAKQKAFSKVSGDNSFVAPQTNVAPKDSVQNSSQHQPNTQIDAPTSGDASDSSQAS